MPSAQGIPENVDTAGDSLVVLDSGVKSQFSDLLADQDWGQTFRPVHNHIIPTGQDDLARLGLPVHYAIFIYEVGQLVFQLLDVWAPFRKPLVG